MKLFSFPRMLITALLLTAFISPVHAKNLIFVSKSSIDSYYIDLDSFSASTAKTNLMNSATVIRILNDQSDEGYSYIKLFMVANCGQFGRISLENAVAYNVDGKQLRSDSAKDSWVNAPADTHFGKIWQEMCKKT